MVNSVINSNLDGTIYTDDISSMKMAIVQTNFDWFFFIGSYDDENSIESFASLINQRIIDGSRQIVIFGLPQEIIIMIESKLDIKLKAISKMSYKFNQESYINNVHKYSSRQDMIIEKIDDRNIDSVMKNIDGIKMFWRTDKNFLEKSFGYVLFKDSEVVSVCFANNMNGSLREIDIFTSEDFRGKGYAVHTCSAFIDHCLEHNLRPLWETVNLNKSSCRLAEKLGFELSFEYPMYVWFNQTN